MNGKSNEITKEGQLEREIFVQGWVIGITVHCGKMSTVGKSELSPMPLGLEPERVYMMQSTPNTPSWELLRGNRATDGKLHEETPFAGKKYPPTRRRRCLACVSWEYL